MSKYEAVPSDVYAEVWRVRWPTGGCSEPYTKAEANIIAWALTAVAYGDTLAYRRDHGFGDESIVTYKGPTDGVAP